MTINAIIRRSDPTASKEGSKKFRTAGPRELPKKHADEGRNTRFGQEPIQEQTQQNHAARLKAIQTSGKNVIYSGVISSFQSSAVFIMKANPIPISDSRNMFGCSQSVYKNQYLWIIMHCYRSMHMSQLPEYKEFVMPTASAALRMMSSGQSVTKQEHSVDSPRIH
jgi:hypothetical protein